MKLDRFQEEACRADHNVVIAAGAGSGKTAILSERYLRLLKERRLPVRSILTLTFTRKAAVEMLDRIYRRLREAIAESSDPFLREQLERFDEARIATFDSFCTTIVRTGCTAYGIAPSFVVDPPSVERLARQCARETLMKHREAAVIQHLVALSSFENVVERLFVDLALEHISLVSEWDFVEKTEKLLADATSQLHKKNDTIFLLVEDLYHLVCECRIPTNYQEEAQQLCSFYSEMEKGKPLPSEFLEWLLSLKIPGGKLTDSFKIQRKEIIQSLRKVVTEVEQLSLFKIFEEEYRQLAVIFDDFASHFNRMRRQQGVLLFRDLSELALVILQKDLVLRQFYKKEIRAIMIDEFQDNNRVQRDLLFLLAEKEGVLTEGIPRPEDLEENKLFFVGDEKQSIYKFRGADVAVFNSLAHDLERAHPPELPSVIHIQNNYRSEPELLDFFNSLFRHVFPSSRDEVPPYEAVYAFDALYPEDKTRPAGSQGKTASAEAAPSERVEIYVASDDFVLNGDSCFSESEALFVAERIIRGVRNKEFSYGDVAILFRTTTHQGDFERIFQRIGIPYHTVDPRGIFAEGPMNDVYALLRLALVPFDVNAYGTVLRSPLVGLSDDVSSRILYDARFCATPFEPFPEKTPDSWFDGLDPERAQHERDCYEGGRNLYLFVRNHIDRRGLASLVASIWYEWGYREYLLNHAHASHLVDQFEYLYHLALAADRRGLLAATFVDEIAPLIGSSERLSGLDTEGEQFPAAVSFLTIHKSKGLQFPVVIIPFCGSPLKGERNDTLYYWHDAWGPLVVIEDPHTKKDDRRASYYVEINKEEEYRKLLAEFRRLLYVAATRAERHLIFVGVRKGISTHGSYLSPIRQTKEDCLSSQEASEKRRISGEEKVGDQEDRAIGFAGTIDPLAFQVYLENLIKATPNTLDKKELSFFDIMAGAFCNGSVDSRLYKLEPLPLFDAKEVEDRIEKLRQFCDDAEEKDLIPLHRWNLEPQQKHTFLSGGDHPSKTREMLGEGLSSVSHGSIPSTILLEPPPAGAWWTSPTAMEQIWQEEHRAGYSEESVSLPATLRSSSSGSPESDHDTLETAFGTLCHVIVDHVFHRLQKLPLNQSLERGAESSAVLAVSSRSVQETAELFDTDVEQWRQLFSVEELMEVIPPTVRRFLNRAHISVRKQEALVLEALEYALRFFHTELGKMSLMSPLSCVEFPFLLPLVHPEGFPKGSILVRGTMDLIFETPQECIIIDFKTDRDIHPLLHQVQLACYRLAGPAFSDKPIRCFLYYLRYGESRELSTPFPFEVLYRLAFAACHQGMFEENEALEKDLV
ncbi:MAG: UvrD-helicase domain-containing protein [Treponemataceae bacterium]|nr:UvrD-helicase domain-containing protein [Treponemataceae bacterium]